MPVMLRSLGNESDIVVDKPILLVGRNETCDVVVDSRKVSRQHCCIARFRDYLIIRDLGSTNGIRVNGEKRIECRVVDGDEVSIAHLSFRVDCHESNSVPVDPPGLPARRAAPLGEKARQTLGIDDVSPGTDLPDSQAAMPARKLDAKTAPDPQWFQIPEDVRLAPESDGDIPLKPV